MSRCTREACARRFATSSRTGASGLGAFARGVLEGAGAAGCVGVTETTVGEGGRVLVGVWVGAGELVGVAEGVGGGCGVEVGIEGDANGKVGERGVGERGARVGMDEEVGCASVGVSSACKGAQAAANRQSASNKQAYLISNDSQRLTNR